MEPPSFFPTWSRSSTILRCSIVANAFHIARSRRCEAEHAYRRVGMTHADEHRPGVCGRLHLELFSPLCAFTLPCSWSLHLHAAVLDGTLTKSMPPLRTAEDVPDKPPDRTGNTVQLRGDVDVFRDNQWTRTWSHHLRKCPDQTLSTTMVKWHSVLLPSNLCRDSRTLSSMPHLTVCIIPSVLCAH